MWVEAREKGSGVFFPKDLENDGTGEKTRVWDKHVSVERRPVTSSRLVAAETRPVVGLTEQGGNGLWYKTFRPDSFSVTEINKQNNSLPYLYLFWRVLTYPRSYIRRLAHVFTSGRI